MVTRPTVVAFFPPVTDAQLDRDPDLNETLTDFQLYAGQIRAPFRQAGIDFHEVYAPSLRIAVGHDMTMFRPTDIKLGYFFVAPGKAPHVQYGVATDLDLKALASDYFHIFIK